MSRTDQFVLILSVVLLAGIVLYILWDGPGPRQVRSGDRTNERSGERIFKEQGCNACHSVDGSPNTGPTLQGVFDTEQTMQDGSTIRVDARYLRESIRHPEQRIVKGYPDNMPSYDHLSEQKVNRLIAYLKQLSGTENHGP